MDTIADALLMVDYLASEAVNVAKWDWLVEDLSEAATARTPIDIKVDRTTLVASTFVSAFVNHYIQADIGTTYIYAMVKRDHIYAMVRRDQVKPWLQCICCKVNM